MTLTRRLSSTGVWNLVLANTGAMNLVAGVADHLLVEPINVYRVTLHPDGMAANIVNLDEWAHHLLSTLHRQVAVTRSDGAARTARRGLDVSRTSPSVSGRWQTRPAVPTVVVPLRLRVADGNDGYTVQSWFSTNTSIGTPVDITLDELHVELFHPADEATRAMTGGRLR